MKMLVRMMNIRWDEESIRKWSSMQKTAYILLPLLIYSFVHNIIETLLFWGLNVFAQNTGSEISSSLSRIAICFSVISSVGAVAVIFPAIKNEIKAGESRGRDLGWFPFLGVTAFLSALGFNLLFYVSGFAESSQSFTKTADAQFSVNFVLGILLYGVCSPLVEEAVFRGLIYNRLKRCFPFPIALIVSAVLFGAYHGNVVQALYGSILGLMMAYVYEKTGSFWASVWFHAVANLSIYMLSYWDSLDRIEGINEIGLMVLCLVGASGCFLLMRKKDFS